MTKTGFILSLSLVLFPLALLAEEMPMGEPKADAEIGIKAEALQKKTESMATPTIKQKLDEKDREQLKRMEDYFNSIYTMKADFMQTLADGRMAKGKILMARPGKMRLQYDPPSKDLLVADGAFVHVWDNSAKTSSSVPLGTSLADVILREHFSFDADIAVTEIRYYPSMMEVVIVQKDNPSNGSLTLEFQDNPLKLRNWRVTDAQGMETRVSLINDEINVKVPVSSFTYREPGFGKSRR